MRIRTRLDATPCLRRVPRYFALVSTAGVVAATLCALPATTATAAMRRETTQLAVQAPHSTALRIRHDDQSTNWSGVADTGVSFTSIEASWQVPTVTPPSSASVDTYSSTWVGIGGDVDPSLIQAGTEQDVTGGGGSEYYAWYELLPNSSIAIDQPVVPGDEMTVLIDETTPSQQLWTITVTDATQHWTFSQSFQYDSPNASAEWIEEAPTVGRSQSTMANFGSVTFSSLGVDGESALIPSGATADRIDYVNSNGMVLAYPEGYEAATNQLTLQYGTPSAPQVTSTTLPDAREGSPYAATLIASGGITPYTWTVQGALPPGLTLNASTGAIQGTPSKAGISSFVAVVDDSDGASNSAPVTLDVLNGTISLFQAPPTTPTVRAGSGYRAQLMLKESSSLTGTVHFTVTKANKMVTVSSSGLVNVARTTPYGTYVTSGSDVDTHGDSGTWTLKVRVTRPTHVVVASSTLPSAIAGQPYDVVLVAFAPSGTPSWSIAGGSKVPKGLSLSKAGVITGKPAISAGGTHRITLRARVGARSVTVERTLDVDVLPSFASSPQTTATAGQLLDVHVAASGLPEPVISAGTLPSWLALTPGAEGTASLAGTVPSDASGSYVVTLDAANVAGSAIQQLTIDVQG